MATKFDAPNPPNPPAMLGPGPTLQDLIASERGPIPEVLTQTSVVDLGTDPIVPGCYTSEEFANREIDRMWSQTWQMACREEDIPDAGDYHVYDIGDVSLLVVRQDDGSILAHHNICLHRGRLIKDKPGVGAQFLRCPFHGFSWNIDGTCRSVTNEWDFPQIDRNCFNLAPAHTATWGGFVFVSIAQDPEPFSSYIEDLPQIFRTRGWNLGERVKAVHVRKTNDCNWKVVLEAFIEAFHVVATHPSAMTYLGDAFTQYDVWPDRRNYTRMISPRGLASPHVGREMTEQEVFDAASGLYELSDEERAIPDGLSARQYLADMRRRFLKERYGVNIPDMTDTEALDTIQYHIFPNLVVWAGWGSFLVYRFRPDGTKVDSSIMDIFFLVPQAEDMSIKPVRQPTVLSAGESHSGAPELGPFAAVFDEDLANLPQVHRGLKAMARVTGNRVPGITLGRYQEMRIRHFHKRIADYLND